MVPTFLRDRFLILDVITLVKPGRKRKSDQVCHATIYKVSLDVIVLHVVVVYLAPDAGIVEKTNLLNELVLLTNKYKNLIIMGDFNINWKVKSNRSFVNGIMSGYFQQKVKIGQTTCHKVKTVGNIEVKSDTTIDLVFISNDLTNRFISVDTLEDSKETFKNDHIFMQMNWKFRPPASYKTINYFPDPTRRPPIKEKDLLNILELLRADIDNDWHCLRCLPPEDIIGYLSQLLKRKFDKYCPLPKPGVRSKRVYRFILSKEGKKLSKESMRAMRQWHKYRQKDPLSQET